MSENASPLSNAWELKVDTSLAGSTSSEVSLTHFISCFLHPFAHEHEKKLHNTVLCILRNNNLVILFNQLLICAIR